MKTEFSGKDKDAIGIIKSLENNPFYSLEVYSLAMNQNLGVSWFVVDVSEKAHDDHWIVLCINSITKSELDEIKGEVNKGVGDRRNSIIMLRTNTIVRCNFKVVSTIR